MSGSIQASSHEPLPLLHLWKRAPASRQDSIRRSDLFLTLCFLFQVEIICSVSALLRITR